MKKILCFILLLFTIKVSSNDFSLENIQRLIDKSFMESVMSSDPSNLDLIENKIDSCYKINKSNLLLYWKGYSLYYKSIYFLKVTDKKQAEEVIDKAISIIDKMKNKTSEDYSLLALLRNFSIQFKSGISAGIISSKVKKDAKISIELDSMNLRGYYIYASNDYYTPEKYGGGKSIETYLLKAIKLPDQQVLNNAYPSWGKEESYELLIKFYIKKQNWELAKKYFKEANNAYPNNYMINQLAGKLIDK